MNHSIDHNVVKSVPNLRFQDVDKEADLLFLSRQDYKFLVPLQHLEGILKFLAEDYYCKSYNDECVFKYHNTYFDTEDYKFFNLHRQGKYKRIKIRVRDYKNGKKSKFIECKRKERGFLTTKRRQEIASDTDFEDALDQSIVREDLAPYGLEAGDLSRLTHTVYDRISLRSKDGRTRISLDFNLESGEEGVGLRPIVSDHLILEVKSNDYPKDIIAFLRSKFKVREANFSKYCVSLCVLNPELRRNKWKQVVKRYCYRERG